MNSAKECFSVWVEMFLLVFFFFFGVGERCWSQRGYQENERERRVQQNSEVVKNITLGIQSRQNKRHTQCIQIKFTARLFLHHCSTGTFFLFFFRQSRRNFWKNGYWLSPWHVHVSHFKPKNFSNISFVVKIPQINCSVKKIWFHMLLWKMLCFYTWTYFQRLLTLYRAEESKKDSLWRGKLSSNKFVFSPLFLLIYKLKCSYFFLSNQSYIMWCLSFID